MLIGGENKRIHAVLSSEGEQSIGYWCGHSAVSLSNITWVTEIRKILQPPAAAHYCQFGEPPQKAGLVRSVSSEARQVFGPVHIEPRGAEFGTQTATP